MMLICTMVAVECNVPRQRRQKPRAVIYPLTADGDTDMYVRRPSTGAVQHQMRRHGWDMQRCRGGWTWGLRLISRRRRVNVVGNDIAQAEISLALSASSLI
jgi:hypothetical protein